MRSFGKLSVIGEKVVSGFVADRFFMPMFIEACRSLEEGWSRMSTSTPW